MATIVTLIVINFFWGAQILFKNYFKQGIKEYLFLQIRQAGITLIGTIVTILICSWLPPGGSFQFVCRIIICVVVPNIIFYFCYFKTNSFAESKQFAMSVFVLIEKKFKIRSK